MARSLTAMFEVEPLPTSDGISNAAIRTRMEEVILNRMEALSSETIAISSDLEALRMRLSRDGHHTEIEDIRAARWWRTKHELLLARTIYRYVCQVSGVPERVMRLDVSADDDSDDGVPAISADDTDG